MDVILLPLITILIIAIKAYYFIVVVYIILHWLQYFNVVNSRNQFVYAISSMCWRMTEPVLRRIRRLLPDTGSLDLSPMILILALIFLEVMFGRIYAHIELIALQNTMQ